MFSIAGWPGSCASAYAMSAFDPTYAGTASTRTVVFQSHHLPGPEKFVGGHPLSGQECREAGGFLT